MPTNSYKTFLSHKFILAFVVIYIPYNDLSVWNDMEF